MIRFLRILMLLGLYNSCSSQYYSEKDFDKVKKIDAHFHINSERYSAIQQAQADNFRLLTINVNTADCANLRKQYSHALKQKEAYHECVAFAASFCMEGFGTLSWNKLTADWLDSCLKSGAVAVKVWKNIGMSFRDDSGKIVMIDDTRLDTLFNWIAGKNIPVVGHLGEPKNCWLPLAEMTTRNDSLYFSRHPQYHMYLHPELPSYEAQIATRDKMLEKHPDLKFIACHLASLEWDVDRIASFLDNHSNAAVDMSARMGQLFYQSRKEREKVRDFFIKYQDRILYGTDSGDAGDNDSDALKSELHRVWTDDWKYLTTDEYMTSNLISGKFQGIKLPGRIIDKIYYKNAVKWYNLKNTK